MNKIQFGFHASGGGHLDRLPLITKALDGECFQFFSRNPYGGKVVPINEEIASTFKKNCEETGVKNSYIHAPYYINLASKNNRIFYGSIKALQEDMERAEILGAKYVVTHVGSARDFKEDVNSSSPKILENINPEYRTELLTMAEEKNFSPQAFERVVKALEKIADGKSKIPMLLEIAAGSGAILGVKFEELAFYLDSVPAISGICFDTAHAFASGYDLRSKENLENIFNNLERLVSQEKIKLIHLNDSIGELGSRIDRHAHIGNGNLGRETFVNLVDYFTKKHYNVDMILETPTKEGLKNDLALLKKHRSEAINNAQNKN